MLIVDLDMYFELKKKKIPQIFIFLLGEEYSHLNSESTYFQSLKCPVYAVRMGADDFRTMDIGMHPKIICVQGSKEIFELNGIPTLNFLKQYLIKQTKKTQV